MSQGDVEKIKDRLGIEEVVSSYIQVEKAGKNLKARCPFHNEKTPSFFISPDRGTYVCFGCGAKGDIFSFVQQFEGLDFYGALKQLSEKAGVPLSKSGEVSKNQVLYDVLEDTTKFFQKNLEKNKEALTYLKGRGIKDETISEWQIGFANDSWDDLYLHLQKKGYKESDIDKAGLIKKRESGSGYYNRFRKRIMFPIFDSVGRTVAFTGRMFESETDKKSEPKKIVEAKYVNSPETELFIKSHILYGFNFAKTAIRRNNFSVLVEGQVDAIMAHQVGYKNAVASSGTALTEDQLRMLNKISNRLLIAYDSDKAGIKASERAWQMALEIGMDIKITQMKTGMDPAELIKSSKKEWVDAVKNAVPIIDYMIDSVCLECDPNYKRENGVSPKISDPRKLIKLIHTNVVPYIAKINNEIEKAHYVKKLQEIFDVDQDVIWKEVNKKTARTDLTPKAVVETEKAVEDLTEKQIIGLYFWIASKDMGNKLSEYEKKLLEFLEVSELEELKDRHKDFREQLIFYIDSQKIDDKRIDLEIEDSLASYRFKTLKNKRSKLRRDLKKAEEKNDEEEIDRIFKEIDYLSKSITDLSG